MIIILFKILILFRICLDLKRKHLTLWNGMVEFCSKHLAIPSKFYNVFNIIVLVLIKYNVMVQATKLTRRRACSMSMKRGEETCDGTIESSHDLNLEPNHQCGQQTSIKSTQNLDLWTNFSYRPSGHSSRPPCRPHVFNWELILGLDFWENIGEIENYRTWVLCRIGPFQSPWGIFTKVIAIWEKIVVLWNQHFQKLWLVVF